MRKAASAVDVSSRLVYHILHDDLHVKPYKYQEWYKLEEYNYEKRGNFFQWFILRPQNTNYFSICSDLVYFYLKWPLSKQNNRILNFEKDAI